MNKSLLYGRSAAAVISVFVPVWAIVAGILLYGCTDGRSNNLSTSPIDAQATTPVIADGGQTIHMSPNSTDQITSVSVQERNIAVDLKAPARIVLSAVASAGASPALMFESTDLSDAISDYLRVRAQLEKSEREMGRLEDLVAHQAAAGRELLDVKTEVAQLQASLAQSESKIRLSGLDLESTLHLPSGKVILVADVPESQLRMVHRGGPANVVLNAYPNETFVGKITAIANVIDPVTRSVKVEVCLSNPGGRLLAGMYGEILLGVNEKTATAVPASSVLTAQGKSFVFVETTPGTYKRREVLAGLQGSDWTELLDGIRAGEKVVDRGAILLKGLSFGY